MSANAPTSLEQDPDGFFQKLRDSRIVHLLVSNTPGLPPACNFYMRLWELFARPEFNERHVQSRIVDFYDLNFTLISLPRVTVSNLRFWHGHVRSGNGSRILETITNYMVRDTAAYLETDKRVRYFLKHWIKNAKVDTLIVHRTSVQEIGDGMAKVSFLVSDVEAFRRVYEELQRKQPLA